MEGSGVLKLAETTSSLTQTGGSSSPYQQPIYIVHRFFRKISLLRIAIFPESSRRSFIDVYLAVAMLCSLIVSSVDRCGHPLLCHPVPLGISWEHAWEYLLPICSYYIVQSDETKFGSVGAIVPRILERWVGVHSSTLTNASRKQCDALSFREWLQHLAHTQQMRSLVEWRSKLTRNVGMVQ